MDFELTEEQLATRTFVRDLAEREIKPLAMTIDKEHKIPDELTAKLADLGYFGTYFPEDLKGAGLDFLSYILVIEEISRFCGSTGVLLSAHTSLGTAPIAQFGTNEQQKKFMPQLTSGEKIGCFLLTEPDAGSDVANLSTRYRKTDKGYLLSGTKIFTTNGGYKGIGIVFATSDKNLKHKGLSAFILDLTSPGVEILKNEDKMGIRGSYTTSFALDEAFVPMENLLGQEGDGFKIAMETLNGGRIGIAAQALGIAQGAFDKAKNYALERHQFGKPIAELQAIQFKLADMAMKIESSRLLTYKAACLKGQNKPHSTESAMAKTVASDTAMFCADEAIQIHGGYGYIVDYEVERMFRDAKITQIYEGTNEVQRIVIAKSLLKP